MAKSADGILLARIGAPHGLRGEVRLTSHTGDPDAIADYGPLTDANGREFAIVALRRAGNALIVRFAGVDSRDLAEDLSGTQLYVQRSALPPIADPDEFYLADLVGLSVWDMNGNPVGSVLQVHDFGAGGILEIGQNRRASRLYAFTRENFPRIDVENGFVTLSPPREIDADKERESR